MRILWRGRAVAALAALTFLLGLGASPALANYVVKDGAGATQTMCSVVLSGVQTPCHKTPDGALSGTLNAASSGASYQMTLGQGQASMVVYVAGLSASGATLTFKASVDSSNYVAVNRPDPTGVPTSTITADGLYTIPVHGKSAAGLFVTSTGSGTITLSSTSSVAFSGDVRLNAPLPPGTNPIGSVSPYGASSADSSGAVTTGGAYQTVIAANVNRKGCLIQNPTTATEVLNVKVGTMANPFTVPIGGSFSCAGSGGLVVTDSITITAATTGHAFAAVSQ